VMDLGPLASPLCASSFAVPAQGGGRRASIAAHVCAPASRSGKNATSCLGSASACHVCSCSGPDHHVHDAFSTSHLRGRYSGDPSSPRTERPLVVGGQPLRATPPTSSGRSSSCAYSCGYLRFHVASSAWARKNAFSRPACCRADHAEILMKKRDPTDTQLLRDRLFDGRCHPPKRTSCGRPFAASGLGASAD